MQSGLSVKFNHKAPPKEIKSESEIRVGVRKKADGTSIYVRAGKVVNETPCSVHEKKINEMKQAAVEACNRQREDARLAQLRMNPEGIKVHRNSDSKYSL